MNVDQNNETAQTYGIMGIPTVILFKDGEVVDTKVGMNVKEEYTSAIEKYL